MLSKAYSTYQSELEMINQFKSGLQIVKEVIDNRLSEKFNIKTIAINISPLLNVPLFCLADANDSNQITIEVFLNKCVERWLQEAQYQQEILNLKDQIIYELEKLCNKMRDEDLIDIVRKQEEQIIETLFNKANFDKKRLAADFCKSFMNGFEIEMIEKIEYYATYVVWMPFTTALPEGLIEFVMKVLHEEVNEVVNEATLLNVFAKIVQNVQDQLEERVIQIHKEVLESGILSAQKIMITTNQLPQILDADKKSRKLSSLIINYIEEDSVIISNERSKIQTIIVKFAANQFLKTNISFIYEYLELNDLDDNDDFEQVIQIFQRLPKCLKSANLQFKKNKQNGIQIISKDQEQKYVNNKISYDQMKFLARLRNLFLFPLLLIIINFQSLFIILIHFNRYQPKGKGTDEEIITLSNVFTHSKTLQHLYLNFSGASITTGAIDHLATSIIKMNQMKHLHLNFSGDHFGGGNNSANNNSMLLFAQAISEMPNLYHLEFHFSDGNNEITDDGIVQLGRVIAKSVSVQQLILYFGNNLFLGGNNAVTDKGIEKLSQCIAYLSNIQQLKLNFSNGNHETSDKGMQLLAAALKNTNISNLYLNFSGGKNSITDASMTHLSDALKQMSSELSIVLNFMWSSNQKVTAKGESIIRSARTYKKMEFYYT